MLENKLVKKFYAINPLGINPEQKHILQKAFHTCNILLDQLDERAEMINGYSSYTAEIVENQNFRFIYIYGLIDL